LVRKFIASLESGEVSAKELADRCLRRIAETEPEVLAWAAVAAQPRLRDGPLLGLPFGAKDIFETRDLPTAYGSPLYEGRRGTRDAALIGELGRAGAVLLGKTHTAVFASFDPAPTRNPRFPGHTPGGSSAGSAAAVAAGMVPFAIGTQTLGSVLRPASYCGVCGFKPSYGLISIEGALPFAPSFDTVGFFTESADDMECLWTLGFGGRCEAQLHRAARFRVAVEEGMERAVEAAAEALRASGVEVDEMDPPAGWDGLLAAARTVNAYEGARSHAARYREFGDRIGIRLAALVREGLAIAEGQYQAALEHIAGMRGTVSQIFWEYPAILTPAAAGAAPEGLASTGDPSQNAPWTALGLPAISVPLPGSGAPLGLQITAAWGRDDALVSVAAHAERLLGQLLAGSGSRNRSA
jgi:Asp-tRNA(Asn)/Glu-tRNA(Gln) amidotransferase A subunit family amidase